VVRGQREDRGSSLSVAAPASLTELRNALDRYRATEYDIEATLEVADVSADEIEELASWPATSFELAHEHTFLVITQVVDRNERFDEMEIRALLAPLLKRNRLTFVSFDQDPQQFATVGRATIEINPRGLTVGEAFRLGEEIAALWDAALFGVLTPSTVIDLLRAGRTGVLIGQPENEWLEAKGSPYLLDEDFAKVELAKDVAALANERHGGLLIVGLQTSKEQGKDVIRRQRPVRLSMLNPARHRRTLDRRVYPPVEDLVVEAVEVETDKGVLFISFPPQPDELKPFLVTGAISSGKLFGTHVSLVRRRHDDTLPSSPAAIHSLLVAGRAALAAAGGRAADSDRSPTADVRK
jgi:hypothetical protein